MLLKSMLQYEWLLYVSHRQNIHKLGTGKIWQQCWNHRRFSLLWSYAGYDYAGQLEEEETDCNLRISSKLFEDVEVGRKIRSIWENNLAGCGAMDNLRGKIIETSMYLHEETKNRIVRSKEREVRLRRAIAAAQRMLQKNPNCQWSRSGLEAAKETLQRLIVSRNKMVFRSSAA